MATEDSKYTVEQTNKKKNWNERTDESVKSAYEKMLLVTDRVDLIYG